MTPDTIEGWKAVSDRLLSAHCCVFHRNMEISSRYAWMHELQPGCFKWAAMAAIASHHVRLALFPLRLDTDRSGYLDIARSLGRRRVLLTEDVNTIRATNNAIFDDIFWVHLAYVTADDGIARLRTLLRTDRHDPPLLSGFEAIDEGRRVLEDATASPAARRMADDLIWAGNLQLLEHEQRAVVQPNFDRLSCAFARLVSIGSATSFDVRGVRPEVTFFTSFYLSSLTRGIPRAVRARAWPRITRYDDRWRWLETSVVPRFRRFADTRLIDATLQRIVDDVAPSHRRPASTSITRRRARAERPPAAPRTIHASHSRDKTTNDDDQITCAGAGTMGSQVAWRTPSHERAGRRHPRSAHLHRRPPGSSARCRSDQRRYRSPSASKKPQSAVLTWSNQCSPNRDRSSVHGSSLSIATRRHVRCSPTSSTTATAATT